MGITNFQIVLDSPSGAYYAGQNVTGKVLLTLDKPKKVRALIIKFQGIAKVSWSETDSVRQNDGNTRNETVTYTAEEEYFSNKYNLAGGGNSELELPAGDLVYPFSTSLPPLLPSSFEGEHGYVRYTVKATLDRPWKFDQDSKSVFTVVTPVDLNFNARAKEPVKKELAKTFCCCWCKSGPLTLVVMLPFSGFVPGQSIPLTIEVDNVSNVEVERIKCILSKKLTFKAREPRNKERSDTAEVIKLSMEGVEPNGSKSWTQQLTIPIMPPCNLDQCSIIHCEYELKVIAEVGGMHSNLQADIPIFIGTVPVMQVQPAPSSFPDPASISQPSAPLLPNDQNNGPPAAPAVGFTVHPGPTEGNLYPTIPPSLLAGGDQAPMILPDGDKNPTAPA
uniref:Arrestin C-terminal-like domain-containing protein n=1 Tax=Clastoptera arizonana TaxID=38151 RepID=A0A1B6CJ57_9HEMI